MHSSGMRTGRSLTVCWSLHWWGRVSGPGGVCSQGGLVPGGVWSGGGGGLLWGGVYIPACTVAEPPPPPPWTDTRL